MSAHSHGLASRESRTRCARAPDSRRIEPASERTDVGVVPTRSPSTKTSAPGGVDATRVRLGLLSSMVAQPVAATTAAATDAFLSSRMSAPSEDRGRVGAGTGTRRRWCSR